MQTVNTLDGMWNSQTRSYTFQRTVEVPKPFTEGRIPLYFYHPKPYQSKAEAKYPVVVNFHGGGFTIGNAQDDIKWANRVSDALGAVVVSVGYRKAPEYPYPTAVQDGALALDYLANHAEELCLDTTRVMTSGFSAGANLSITVPLLYAVLQQGTEQQKLHEAHCSAIPSGFDSKTMAGARCDIVAIASFYPAVDYTLSRPQRRATNPKPSENMPATLSSLFDHSYLPVRAEDDPSAQILRDPFLSPAQASVDFLQRLLPDNIFILTCEYDMLQEEGERFVGRLKGAGKDAKHVKIEKVGHGWDKVPWIVVRGDAWEWGNRQTEWAYAEACSALKSSLGAT